MRAGKMSVRPSLETSPPQYGSTVPTATVLGLLGVLAPFAVVLYEHRLGFLPIRVIEILWPSSLLFFPDPTRRFPVLINSLSIALNAAIFAAAGFLLGAFVDFLLFRRRSL
jgi:hypothetical protein